MAPPLELRVPPARVVLHEEELDPDPFEHERALPVEMPRVVPVEIQAVDDAPVLRGIEQVEVDVLARLDQPTQLLTPAAEHPRVDSLRREKRHGPCDEGEVVHAVAATSSSRGSRRETICETPSLPIVTPYRTSAASIVRFWCVITMNCARSA